MMVEEEPETMMVEEEPEPVMAETSESTSSVSTISVPAGSGVPGCEETDECYIPFEATVPVGTTVTWINDDSAAHTVTSGTVADGPDGLFDSSIFMAGDTFEYTFDESGTYDYFCIVHPWMVGKVTVSDMEEMSSDSETMMVEEEPETMMVEEEPETMMVEEEPETMMVEEEPETMMVEEEPEPVMAETSESTSSVSTISVPAGSGVPGCEETDECYIPFEATVPVGTTVTWINDDSAAHTVTSGTVADGPDGLFDSSIFMAGDTFEYTFDESGTYDYFCIVHPWMVGKVTVSDMEEMSSDSETMMVEEEPETMMVEEEPETMMVEEEPEPVMAETSESTSSVSTISVPAGSGVPGCEETDECYIPFEATVPVGTTVTWINDDSAAHTVTSGTVEAGLTGIFDSGLFLAGDSYEFTFTETGTYDYFCMVHPWMVGIVNII